MSPTVDACTQGIWMWTQPMVSTTDDNEPLHIFFLGNHEFFTFRHGGHGQHEPGPKPRRESVCPGHFDVDAVHLQQRGLHRRQLDQPAPVDDYDLQEYRDQQPRPGGRAGVELLRPKVYLAFEGLRAGNAGPARKAADLESVPGNGAARRGKRF